MLPEPPPVLPLPGMGSGLLPEPVPAPLLPGLVPEPVLLPVLLPVPVLPGVEDVPPPDALPGLVIFSSSKHFFCSAPVMPRHFELGLELELPVAPPEALPELLPLAAGALLEPLDLLLSVELPVALGVDVDPALLPALPDVEPGVCANEVLAIAKSAAAVAVTTSFSFI